APPPQRAPAPPAAARPATIVPPAPAPRPATAPVPVRPPTAPVAAATPAAPGTVPKLLKETEVYIKYGLHEKALEHLRKIFAAEPDNLEAHDKAKAVALASNRPQDAVASLATLVRLYVEGGDPRAATAKEEL